MLNNMVSYCLDNTYRTKCCSANILFARYQGLLKTGWLKEIMEYHNFSKTTSGLEGFARTA